MIQVIDSPASLMLAGEHAVLEGAVGVAMAVAPQLRLSLQPLASLNRPLSFQIETPFGNWAGFASDLLALSVDSMGVLSFVLSTLQSIVREHSLNRGEWHIQIGSEISAEEGLGSSAAVVAGLFRLFSPLSPPTTVQLNHWWRQGRAIIRTLQGGRGSGADLAASLWGGLILCEGDSIRRLEKPPRCFKAFRYYMGYKTPTAVVLQQLVEQQKRVGEKDRQTLLKQQIGAVARHWIEGWKRQDALSFGESIRRQQALFKSLGVSDDAMDMAIEAAESIPGVLGAKISGSGLGDSLIAWVEERPSKAGSDLMAMGWQPVESVEW